MLRRAGACNSTASLLLAKLLQVLSELCCQTLVLFSEPLSSRQALLPLLGTRFAGYGCVR